MYGYVVSKTTQNFLNVSWSFLWMTSSKRSTRWAGCSLWMDCASSALTTWLTTKGDKSLSTVIARRNLSRCRSINFLYPSSIAKLSNYSVQFTQLRKNITKDAVVCKLAFRPAMLIDWSFQSLLIPILQIWHVKERRARDRVEQSMIVRTPESIVHEV